MHTSTLRRALCALALLLFCVAPVLAAPATVEADAPRLNLTPHLRYLVDAGQQLGIEQVRASGDWQAVEQDVANFGYSQDAYWLEFSLRNPSREPLDRLLEVGYPLLDSLDLYVLDEAGRELSRAHAGDMLPFAARAYPHRNFVFPVALPPEATLRLFLRVQSTSSTQIPLSLWQPRAFQAANESGLAFQGVYAGIMLAMIVYNLFIFLSVRERAYIYYVLFIACSGLLFLELRGIPYEFLWPRAAWWQQHGIAALVFALPLFGSLFAISFLNLRQHSRVLMWWLRGVGCVATAGLIAVPFITYPVAIQIAVANTLAWILGMVASGLVALWRGEKAARYYLAAWGLFLGAAFMIAVYQFGVIPAFLVGERTIQVASALEALLLSFALADRFNQMRKDKDEAQRHALDSLQRYQALYQEAQYGIFTTSADGQVVSANPAAARLLGYASSEEVLESIRDIGRDLYVDQQERARMLELLREQGHINGFETRMRRKDGGFVWVSVSGRLVQGDDGQYLEGSIVDITERKERERAEQARALAEKEREAAKLATEAKSAFLSNMSHEIRTPLTAIIGYGEMMLDSQLEPARRKELARTVVRSGHHLLDVINDILDLSKIEAGRLEVERIEVDLIAAIADVQSVFEVRARDKGLEFHIDYRLPLPRRIRTDPTRLKQILYNLCGNAMKFTDRGSVVLQLECDPVAEELKIAVIDTGIGIEADQLEHVFGVFAQADVSTTRRYGGTGLGLSISRQLAQLLGGDVTCSSEVGVGSRFEVRIGTGSLAGIPLLQNLREIAVREESGSDVAVPRLSGRVLHAEDNPDSQRLVAALVRQTGAEVVTVENGALAVERTLSERFDLVLMDIQMPVMDGFGALAALRRAGDRTPVAALTANVMAEDRAAYQAAGFVACEGKPLDRGAFFTLLQRYLAPAPEGEEPTLRVRGRVLVAEDNGDNQQLLEWLLRRIGAAVTVVESGPAAVEAALAGAYDLVLMDKEMPGGDGLEAVALLRQAGCQAPIYLLTAQAEDEVREACREAGCNGYLGKPLELGPLYAVIAEHLSAAAMPQPVPEPVEDDEDAELAALARTFLQGLPNLLQRMEAAAAAADWSETAGLAHQLKGSGGSFGFPELTREARQLEQAARSGEAGAVEAALRGLRQSVDEALQSA